MSAAVLLLSLTASVFFMWLVVLCRCLMIIVLALIVFWGEQVISHTVRKKVMKRKREYLHHTLPSRRCFAHDIDLSGMQVDVALRKFQTHYRMPGEAQKIERLMQVFAQRYCQCNRDIVAKMRDADTMFVLAFAIIMLNTDLHTASMKQEKRMKLEDFIKNLRGGW